MGARVLLLLSKTSYRVTDFMRAARNLDIEVVVGSDQENLLAALSGNGVISLDFRKIPEAVDAVVSYARKFPLTAIIPVDEVTGQVGAQASDILGLVQNPPRAVENASNKFSFRSFLTREGLSDVGFERIDRQGDIARSGRAQSYPKVLKPLALSGSRGVIRVNNDNEFGAAIERIGKILDSCDFDADADESRFILSEDYIEGAEIAVEGLIEAGRLKVLAIFDKPDPLEGPYFEESIYVTPSRHSEAALNGACALMQQAIDGLGMVTGPVHGEIRINDAGAHLIELAPRSIGGLCSRVLELGAQRSLEEIILMQAIRQPVVEDAEMAQAAGVMMIPIPAKGTLQAVTGLEEAHAVQNVTDVTISIPLGGDIIPLPEGNRYLGFIFARAKTPDLAEQALREAHACLDFQIR